MGGEPLRARLARDRAGGHGTRQGRRARRRGRRLVARLRRQGQGLGALRRRPGRDRRRLAGRAVIVPDPIEQYAQEHTTPPTELLERLAAETRETLRSPQMLTGPIEGRFLELLVHG